MWNSKVNDGKTFQNHSVTLGFTVGLKDCLHGHFANPCFRHNGREVKTLIQTQAPIPSPNLWASRNSNYSIDIIDLTCVSVLHFVTQKSQFFSLISKSHLFERPPASLYRERKMQICDFETTSRHFYWCQ